MGVGFKFEVRRPGSINEGGMLRTVEQALSIDRQPESYSQTFTGSVVDRSAMVSSCSWLRPERSVPLGRYWRTSPLVSSKEPCWLELCGSQNYTAVRVRLVASLSVANSLPWSYVIFWRMGWAMPSSLSLKACITLTALAGLNSGRLMRKSSRLVRSSRVPTALALAAPSMRLLVYSGDQRCA